MMSWEQGAESSVYTVLHYGTTQCSTVYNHYRWKQKVRRLPLGLRCRKSKGFCDTKLSVMIETGLITPSWHIVLRGTLLGSRAEQWSLASGRGWGPMGRHYTVNVSTRSTFISACIYTAGSCIFHISYHPRIYLAHPNIGTQSQVKPWECCIWDTRGEIT